ncbi:MAG: DUF2149 domain-containing protein [Planctomycetota bacterium]
MTFHKTHFENRSHLNANKHEDPLSGMANLFDVGMVFALALLIALITSFGLSELLSEEEVTIIKNPGRVNMEMIIKKGKELKKFRVSDEQLGGEGERLGICYQLKNGQMVYVPDQKAKGSE